MSAGHTRLAIGVLGSVVCACTGTPPSAPKPSGIAPSRIAAGSATAITVSGDDFFADIVTDFRRHTNSTLSAAFKVTLSPDTGDPTELDATLVDVNTLTADVPALSVRGLYDVTVTDPSGATGSVTGGLRVVTSAESVAAFQFDPIEMQHASVPFIIGLTALDEVGHTVDGFDGTATVTVPGAAQPVTVGPFQLGRGRAIVTVPAVTAGLTLTARDALGHAGTSDPFDVAAGDAAHVAFVEAPARVAAGGCGGPFTLEVQDTFGNPAAVAAASKFDVAVNPPEGRELYSDAACGTKSSSGMLQGRSTFFVRSTKAGRPEVHVVPEAWPSAVRAFDVDAGAPVALAIVSAPQVLAAGQCSQPVVVQAQDAFGNAAAVAAPVDLSPEVDPSQGVTLHSESTCATALSALQLKGTEARFFFRSAVPAMLSVSVDGGVMGSVAQGEEVTP